MIREFKEEIERLRKLLAEKDGGGGASAALMASMMSGMLGAQGGAAQEQGGTSVRASELVPERPKEQPPRHDYTSPVKRSIQEVSCIFVYRHHCIACDCVCGI